MNSLPTNGSYPSGDGHATGGSGEETLRLIARLPAPEGLENRVKAGLRSSPATGRMVMWRDFVRPAGGWMYSSLVRGAAAAAIVCVVAGGGWRIYSHVQPAPAANAVVPVSTGNGFSNANAVRVPETLDRPVLKHPAPEVNVVEKAPAEIKSVPAIKKKKAMRPSLPVE
jgi:hypothetical protein